jgi:signal transduction histidine kinase
LSGRLVRIAEETMLILVQEDITEKRQNEQAIRNMNVTLEKRVSERTHELEVANTELTIVLEDLQRAQQELLRTEKMAALGSLVAGVAHELNTPIGTSVTVASTLQQQTTEIYQQFQQGLRKSVLEDYLSNARLGTDLLLRNLSKASELVASFKQVAVDRTSANRRQFALDEMMDELILTLGPMIRKTPHEVIADIPAKMLLDSYPGALGQVMTNLINNAFIHAFDADVRGQVRIEGRDKGEECIEITVTDNGKGIPPANIGRIFDPFFTTRLGQGGSGLGLNIVYNLVKDVLGGDIRVSSTVGEGTRFSMSIPKIAKISETPH